MSKKLSAIAVVALLMLATAQMAMATGTPTNTETTIASSNVACQPGYATTFGITAPGSLEFGIINVGGTSTLTENIAVTSESTEGLPCVAPPAVEVSIIGTDWLLNSNSQESMVSESTTVTSTDMGATDVPVPDTTSFVLPTKIDVGSHTVIFKLTVPNTALVGMQSQTITITGTY